MANSKTLQCNFKEQQNIIQVLQKAKKYNKQDPQYKCITRKLVVFIAAKSTPNSISGNTFIGKRNRLSGNNLETEVLIKNNKNYLHI